MNPHGIENKSVVYYTHHDSYYSKSTTMLFSTAPYPSRITSKSMTKSRVHSSRAITPNFGAIFGTIDNNGLFKYIVPKLEALLPHPQYVSTSKW